MKPNYKGYSSFISDFIHTTKLIRGEKNKKPKTKNKKINKI